MARCDGVAARFLAFAILSCAAARLIARFRRSVASAATMASQQQTGVLPSLERTPQVDVLPIFLSHSGKQKGFVERLNEELWNAGHHAFFDQHSIPKGVPFPKYIEEAVTQAKVGLVILSNDFMSSKWPMIELDLLTKSSAEVIPLFYKLSPGDVKSPMKLSEWRKKWNKMAQKDVRINVSAWEKAVMSLVSQAGEIYRSEASEGEYIKRILRAICQKLPPSVTYDVSYAKGQRRIIQEVDTQFQQALMACKSCSDISIIGMHGVGGLGKTTLCKLMANFYKSAYSGKCAVMEFPTVYDKVAIVDKCKYVLKLLTHASEKNLENVHDFDQAVQLLKERMKSYPVFLALDNIWEHSLKEARRILEAGFGAGSKVLVTSRSEPLLKDLLRDRDKAWVKPLTNLNKDEAFETFQASFEGNLSITSRTSVDRVVRLCMFSGSYHPLALSALGVKLKFMVMEKANDARVIKENLDHIMALKLQGSDIESLIKINYNGMNTIWQHMFLDVAVIFRRTCTFKRALGFEEMGFEETGDMGFEEMCEWLSTLYELECNEIEYNMQQMALRGLLQFEGEGKKRRVVVHDLYVALAKGEAAASPRILLAGSTNMDAVRWAELERVVLDTHSEDTVELQDCPKLQLLYASERTFSRGLQLEASRDLRLLKVENCSGNLTGLKAVPKLAAFHLQAASYEAWARFGAVQEVCSCGELRSLVLDGEGIFRGAEGHAYALTDLQTLELKGWVGLDVHRYGSQEEIQGLPSSDYQSLQRILDLGGLGKIRSFDLLRCRSLEEIRGLPSSLESIDLSDCQRLQRIPDLGGLGQLRSLDMWRCGSLKKIQDLPSSLESITLFHCQSLEKIPDLGRLGLLRSFDVWRCGSLEDIQGLPSSLESIHLVDCQSLQKIPDLGELGQLRRLDMWNCGSLKEIQGLPSSLESIDLGGLGQLLSLHMEKCGFLEEIQGLPSSLESIRLSDCQSLQRIPDLGGLGQLQRLDMWSCESLKEIQGFSPSLESFYLRNCQSLQRIPDLSGLGQLMSLHMEKCGFLEEIQGLPSSLESIRLSDCQSLLRIPDLGGLQQLRSLHMQGCGSVEEIWSLPSSLERIYLCDCQSLRRIRDLGGLRQLRSLHMEECGSLEEIRVLPSSLESILLFNCQSLQMILDLGGLGQLRSLDMRMCGSLQEIRGRPSSLESIRLFDCQSLQRISEVGGLGQLRILEMEECGSLEEIRGLPSSLESIRLFNCQSLKRIPDLGGLGQLQSLDMEECGFLEEIRGLPSSLQRIRLFGCQSLLRIPDLGGLKQLRSLHMEECRFLEGIRGLPSSLESIFLSDIQSLQRILDLGGLGQLRRLTLWRCGSVEEIRGLLSSLESIFLSDCESLQRILDLGGLCQLRRLNLWECGSLEEIRGLPSSLESIDLSDCQSLLRIPDLGGLGQLRSLDMRSCGSLEEIRSLPSSLETIRLSDCQSLQSIPDLGGLGQLRLLKVWRCGSLEDQDLLRCTPLEDQDVWY